MSFFSDIRETTDRFGKYVIEMQELFSANKLTYGSPEDFSRLTPKLTSKDEFRADFSTLTKSIGQREGGQLTLKMMLTIVAIAIGGSQVEQLESEGAVPLSRMVVFLAGLDAWKDAPSNRRNRGDPAPVAPEDEVSSQRCVSDVGATGQTSEVDGAQIREMDEAEKLERRLSIGGDVDFDPSSSTGFHEPPILQDALSRLEISTLELKHHLDSIDSRIERMEPHLDEITSRISNAEQVRRPDVEQTGTLPRPLPRYSSLDLPTGSDDEVSETPYWEPKHWRPVEEVAKPKHSSGLPEKGNSPEDLAPRGHDFLLDVQEKSSGRIPIRADSEQGWRPLFTQPDFNAEANAPTREHSSFGLKSAPSTVQTETSSRLAAVLSTLLLVSMISMGIAFYFDIEHTRQADRPAVVEAQRDQLSTTARGLSSGRTRPPSRRRPATPAPILSAAPGQTVRDQRGEPGNSSAIPREIPRNNSQGSGGEDASRIRGDPGTETGSTLAGNPGAASPSATSGAPRATVADANAANANPSTTSSAREPVFVRYDSLAGNILSTSLPVYPSNARLLRVGGDVIVETVISANGTVEMVTPVGGPKELQQAAVDAVRRWRYRSYLLDGEPVAVRTRITLHFDPYK